MIWQNWRGLCVGQFILLLLIYTYLSLTGTPGDHVPLYNDKLMHFAGYTVAGLSLCTAAPNWRLMSKWLFLLGYSSLIEIIQHWVPVREFSMGDILANSLGALAGVGLGTFLAKRWLSADHSAWWR